jgi:3-oxoacyl-[acyl-carrier-protein] synthase III
MERKKLKKNDTIIACGFGVGLSWGVVEIKW